MAVVAIVKAVAIDRSLWASNCALAGVASIAARPNPARRYAVLMASSLQYYVVILPKAGIHRSTAREAAQWIPAFAGMTSVYYSLRRRRALPFSSFSRSSAHSGRVLIHSAPGG